MPSDTTRAEIETIEVTTSAGRVRGAWRTSRAGDRSAAFLGIPFAEPPVGELRFAAPVPHGPWDGVLDATTFGATPQRGDSGITLIPEPSVPGDSTLNVNVFTPTPSSDTGLPVLVYIHGGGYFAGSPASPWYDGAAFNRDGVVTVTISYRLGFDGFGWIADAPHNRGVLDWLLALEWVQQNIADFGGDPGRVTIVGQSAGGGAVLTLLGMPRAQSLFRAACSISGAAFDLPLERAEAFGRTIAKAGGVEPTRAGLASLTEERLLELQNKAMMAGLRGNPLKLLTKFLDDGLAMAPVVDGDLITQGTLDALHAGVGSDKPLLLGTTDDEFAVLFHKVKGVFRILPTGPLLRMGGLKGPTRAAYLAANPDVVRRGTAAVLGRYVTDRMFRTLALRTVGARGTDAATWLYRFTWRSPRFDASVHCLDVPYFFDCLDLDGVTEIAGDHAPQSLADDVHASAVAFAQHGDPGWPRCTSERPTTRVHDEISTIEADGYASVRPLLQG
ncbi:MULTISPECIES: carboxylesterase/lipase family protein [unclassified Nocardioides]|uniref:carboxylesterase/lipase family protein n=1 Tax=unclassified Nocardioides TaxID=2615069 RepID=UPI0006F9F790|nr:MULTISPECIES: carboxylesterase family protein [unclassified Nocardioides]KRA38490.1 carboxylesterase [Nocardioides sp. Root614]KRA92450.1 carboxylesterase [Nocardioides sp. Root682]